MKKTTTINLAGLVFHIEEDGYQILSAYFKDLKHIFLKQEGGEEILADIEARFAELFTEQLSAFKQVITEEDVNGAIAIMGSPHQFEDVDSEGASGSGQESYFHDAYHRGEKKKLYRDTEDGMIAGVAAGTAHYLNLDPALVRILWIVFVLLGGSGILIYIIAWIAIPEAKTTSDKLNMRGQNVNLDSIKAYAENMGKEAKKGFNKASDSVRRSISKSSSGVNTVAGVVLKVFGGFILFIGIISLVGILFAFFFNSSEINFNGSNVRTDVKSLIDLFFFEQTLSFLMILIVSAVPILFMIVFGARLLFGKSLKVRNFSLGLLGLWIIGIIGIAFFGIKSGLDFKEGYVSEEKIFIESPYSQLSLRLFEDDIAVENILDYDYDNYLSLNNGIVTLGYANLEVLTTEDSLFYYTVEKKSNGGTVKVAKDNADGISYELALKDSTLQMPIRYQFPKENKFRDQKVTVKVFVPIGKVLVLYGDLEEYPIKIRTVEKFKKKDVSNTSKWTATERGMVKD